MRSARSTTAALERKIVCKLNVRGEYDQIVCRNDTLTYSGVVERRRSTTLSGTIFDNGAARKSTIGFESPVVAGYRQQLAIV